MATPRQSGCLPLEFYWMNSSHRQLTLRVPTDLFNDYSSAFQTALNLFGIAELTEFLPPRDHPRYTELLCELVRIELVHGWKMGQPTSLDIYQKRYPELNERPALLYRIACEEFALRRKAGQNPSLPEFGNPLGANPEDWPTAKVIVDRPAPRPMPGLEADVPADFDLEFPTVQMDPFGVTPASGEIVLDEMSKTLARTRPGMAPVNLPSSERPSSDPDISCDHFETVSMPRVGDEFLDFFLIGELGRGAFGKVFLAQQGHLAGRLVALKVAMGLFSESQTLAQLQHTNIVPIYSYHDARPYQAVCMPYLGATTLAHVLADIRSQKEMPSSGRDLLGTLQSRRKNQAAFETSSRRVFSTAVDSNQSDGGESLAPEPPAPSALLELEGMSYVDSILWLAARLADGLTHAHERGIIHRDLKPANVLITDEGMPMLLDFNLAHDTKLREGATAASMGGTLPYMAPEHLHAFQGRNASVDARSDVYSIGVILFELLTGASPFPTYSKAPMRDLIERMIVDRKKGSPRLRPLNSDIPPAVESIVLRCLAADPARRYQTARELHEDLQCQLENLPLKHAANPSVWERWSKFRKRHPRLTSTATVSALALLAIAGLAVFMGVREDQRMNLAASDAFTRFQDDAQTSYFLLNARMARTQVDEGERACRAALAHFQVLDDPHWRESSAIQRLPSDKQQKLQNEAGQLLVLLAHAQQLAGENEVDPARREQRYQAGIQFCSLAGECFKDEQAPQSLWKQQGELFRRLSEREKAEAAFERARQTDLKNAHDRYLAARLLAEQGKFQEALPLLQAALGMNPQDYHLHFLQGICHDYLGQHADAIACYRACIALRPSFFGAYYNRGLSYLRLNAYKSAIADFDQVLKLKDDYTEAYVQRALAHQGMSKDAEAIRDLTTALERGFAQTRVYFLRAKLLEKTRDHEAAKADLAEGLRREPTDEMSCIARGIAFLPGDPKRALADFDAALELNPRSLAGLQNKAHVLGKYLKLTQDAVQVLDKAIQHYPDDVRPLAGRGVYLARLGKREAALKDAEAALLLDNGPSNLYQVAGIYALTSRQEPEDQKEALRLLALALKKGFGFDYLEIDRDLDPIRQSPTFRRVIEASRAMQSAAPAKR